MASQICPCPCVAWSSRRTKNSSLSQGPAQKGSCVLSSAFVFKVELHLLVRLVILARLALRLHLANDLLENLHRLQATFALVALHVDFHASVRGDGDVKFALRHGFVGLLI